MGDGCDLRWQCLLLALNTQLFGADFGHCWVRTVFVSTEPPDWKSQNTSTTANRSHNRHCAATVEYDWADLHDEEDRKGAIVERHSSDSIDDITEFGNENIS